MITPAGAQPGPALPGADQFTQIYGMRLSPSGQYAVFMGTTSDQSPMGLYVADLNAGTCCVELQDPAQPNLDPTYVSPFSPDGTQIAVSLLDMASLGNQPPNSAIAVFDLATGQIVATTPLSSIPSEDQWAAAAAFGSWDASGIRVVPSCWGCEGTWEGLYSIWDPIANTVSQPVEPFDIFMQKLPTTGEMIRTVANEAFPLSGAPAAYFAAPNVVEYSMGINQPSQTIYFNPSDPLIWSAGWVDDGRAVYVQLGGKPASLPDNPFFNENPTEGFLLFRDGRQVSVPAEPGTVVTGTPTGWVAYRWDTGELSVVTVDETGNVKIAPAGTIQRMELAATSFTLGASATPGPFPAVQPPARTTCPGFMESRLWPNIFARVTPGEPNTLRAEPALNAASIGTIPGEGVIAVLEGPTCVDNMAWWQRAVHGADRLDSRGPGQHVLARTHRDGDGALAISD